MAKANISFRSSEDFWVGDLILQLAFHYVLLELQNPQYLFSDKSELIDECRSNLDGCYAGFPSLGWDDILTTSSDVESMIALLRNVIIKLHQKGNYISADEMQAIPTLDNHFKISMKEKFKTSELIRLINGIISVLECAWPARTGMEFDWR